MQRECDPMLETLESDERLMKITQKNHRLQSFIAIKNYYGRSITDLIKVNVLLYLYNKFDVRIEYRMARIGYLWGSTVLYKTYIYKE